MSRLIKSKMNYRKIGSPVFRFISRKRVKFNSMAVAFWRMASDLLGALRHMQCKELIHKKGHYSIYIRPIRIVK